MAYARRSVSEDIRANRSWTADAVVDLASIPAKHGDEAYVTATGHSYIYLDTTGWLNQSVTAVANGGTGLSSYTTGDLIYASGATTLAKLAKGTANMVLQQGASAPFWGDIVTVDVLASNSFSTGAITASGLLTLTNGQINFPATQNSSADANTLDDYEEGSWSPGIEFGGASTGLTYPAGGQDGHYIKIGRLVWASFRVELSAKGSSTGTAALTGLPFTSANTDDYGSLFIGAAVNMASLTSAPSGLVNANNTVCSLYDWGATGIANLDDTNFTATSVLAGGAIYLSAS